MTGVAETGVRGPSGRVRGQGAKGPIAVLNYNLTLESFISIKFSYNITNVIFDCFWRIYLAVVLSRNALAVLLLFGEPLAVVHELHETVSFTHC